MGKKASRSAPVKKAPVKVQKKKVAPKKKAVKKVAPKKAVKKVQRPVKKAVPAKRCPPPKAARKPKAVPTGPKGYTPAEYQRFKDFKLKFSEKTNQ